MAEEKTYPITVSEISTPKALTFEEKYGYNPNFSYPPPKPEKIPSLLCCYQTTVIILLCCFGCGLCGSDCDECLGDCFYCKHNLCGPICH